MATTPHNSDDSSIDTDLVETYVTEDGSTIETRETDDGTVEEQCPSCGNWYEQISTHWGLSSCQHPPISEKKWEMCKGLMMGDGCISNRNRKNCTIEIGNTNLTFLEYLEDEFSWLASTLSLQRTAQESADNLNRCNINSGRCDTHPKDCADTYILRIRSHPVFNYFEQWWETSEKVFPQIEYTKQLLRMWWVSDGNLHWLTSRNSRIRFTSVNEGSRPQNIINSFKKVGFDCSLGGETQFTLPVDQTEDFFDFIGHDPVHGFEYKWAWQDKDRYDQLKDECRQKHCTQTLE